MTSKIPDDSNPRASDIITDNNSSIDFSESLQDLKEAGYDNLDLESVRDMPDQEFNDNLEIEGKLRKQLNSIDTEQESFFNKTPEFLAIYLEERGLKDVALEWLDIHLKNRTAMVKRADSSIYIFPHTITLMKAVKILRDNINKL
jgi:hypothetical protein